MIIIGILAGIAIPLFMNQKAKAHEAGVRADLLHAAEVVATYWATDGASWDAIFTATGSSTTTSGNFALASASGEKWTSVPGAERVITSDSRTALALTTVPATGTNWPRTLKAGEMCITATNPNTRWNRPNGSGALTNDQILYFDSAAGGVRTVNQIAKLLAAGEVTSCVGYAKQWVAAGGVP